MTNRLRSKEGWGTVPQSVQPASNERPPDVAVWLMKVDLASEANSVLSLAMPSFPSFSLKRGVVISARASAKSARSLWPRN